MRKPPSATWAIQTDCGRWASEVWCLSPGLQQLEVLGALSSHFPMDLTKLTPTAASFSFFSAVVAGLQGHQKGLIWEFPGGPVVRHPTPTAGVQAHPWLGN